MEENRKINLLIVIENPEIEEDFLLQLERPDVQMTYFVREQENWLEQLRQQDNEMRCISKENQMASDCIVLFFLHNSSEAAYLVREMRSVVRVPILVLSDRESYYEELQCLQNGADDYQSIFRPIPILWARLWKLIQLYHGEVEGQLVKMGLVHHLESSQYSYAGKALELTEKEYQILFWLLHSQEEIVSRQKLLYHIWGECGQKKSRALDTLIKQLRKKLHETSVEIKTCYGKGYVIQLK